MSALGPFTPRGMSALGPLPALGPFTPRDMCLLLDLSLP